MNFKIGKRIYGLLILVALMPFLVLCSVVAYEYLEKEKQCASVGSLTDIDKIKLAINKFEESPIYIDGKLYPKVQHYLDAEDVLRQHPECCRIDDLSGHAKGLFPKELVFVHLSYPVYYSDREGQTQSIVPSDTKWGNLKGFFVDTCGRVDVDW